LASLWKRALSGSRACHLPVVTPRSVCRTSRALHCKHQTLSEPSEASRRSADQVHWARFCLLASGQTRPEPGCLPHCLKTIAPAHSRASSLRRPLARHTRAERRAERSFQFFRRLNSESPLSEQPRASGMPRSRPGHQSEGTSEATRFR
jgi:hypothetical protein